MDSETAKLMSKPLPNTARDNETANLKLESLPNTEQRNSESHKLTHIYIYVIKDAAKYL